MSGGLDGPGGRIWPAHAGAVLQAAAIDAADALLSGRHCTVTGPHGSGCSWLGRAVARSVAGRGAPVWLVTATAAEAAVVGGWFARWFGDDPLLRVLAAADLVDFGDEPDVVIFDESAHLRPGRSGRATEMWITHEPDPPCPSRRAGQPPNHRVELTASWRLPDDTVRALGQAGPASSDELREVGRGLGRSAATALGLLASTSLSLVMTCWRPRAPVDPDLIGFAASLLPPLLAGPALVRRHWGWSTLLPQDVAIICPDASWVGAARSTNLWGFPDVTITTAADAAGGEWDVVLGLLPLCPASDDVMRVATRHRAACLLLASWDTVDPLLARLQREGRFRYAR